MYPLQYEKMKKICQLLLYCFYCLALIVLAECILFRFFPSQLPALAGQFPPHDHMISSNPRIGYELRPSTGDINSDGLRDIEHVVEKKPDIKRIMIIGDSIAYGLGVSLNETYARQLQELLDTSEPDTYEVINLGVPGYGTIQIYERFLQKGLQYSPDIVIYGYWFNDQSSFGCADFQYPFFTNTRAFLWEWYVSILDKYPRAEKFRSFILQRQILLRAAHLYYLVNQKKPSHFTLSKEIFGLPDYIREWEQKYNALFGDSHYTNAIRPAKRVTAHDFQKYVLAFSDLVGLCKSKDIRFILLTTPLLDSFEPYQHTSLQAHASFIARTLDIEHIDTLPQFLKHPLSHLQIQDNPRDIVHFNEKGHQIVAETIASYILSETHAE
jgi:lysophospholipase L1-like esterase